MRCVTFLFVLCVGLTYAQLPSEIPDLDDIDAIKERCDKKGGPGTYDKIKRAKDETQTCIQGLINVDTIKKELEEAKKVGAMDEVFGKYCAKRLQIKECFKKSIDAIQPCLEEGEREALNLTTNIIAEIGNFVCYRDGDRIAMFVAEGGVECLQSRTEGIKNCVNQTLKFNPATFSPNSVPTLKFDKKKCDDLTTIQNCVVKDLEDNCVDTTPANIIDALFRFVKKAACKDAKPKRSISLERHLRNVKAETKGQFQTDVEPKLQATCEKNGPRDSYDKLMASFRESMACLKNYSFANNPVDVYQSVITNCTVRFRKALEDCLTEEEKYFPDLSLKMLLSMLNFYQSYMNQMLGDKQTSIIYSNCLIALKQDKPQKELQKCWKEQNWNQGDDIITIPSKDELCQKLRRFHICLSSIVKDTCIRDIKIAKLLEKVADSVEAPCQKTTSGNEA